MTFHRGKVLLQRFFGLGQKHNEIYPDEILLDSSNLPSFDTYQFEGRIVRPIGKGSILLLGVFFALVGIVYAAEVYSLQIEKGSLYAAQSEENRLREDLLFAYRGLIMDRTGERLAWNKGEGEIASRIYTKRAGLGLLLGYAKPPAKDAAGFYYQDRYRGKDGIEKSLDEVLAGENGANIIEVNARGEVISEHTIRAPQDGGSVVLSVDASVEEKLFEEIGALARHVGFKGGSGVIMDVQSGELLAMANYPEYSSQALSEGDASRVKSYRENPGNPYLDRATAGLFAPGSIMKLFVAAGVLAEKIINPEKEILSTGSISVSNPYNPEKPSVFKDWKAHGYVDLRHALAVSSDVYFYVVGGGFEGQKGLGIEKIASYASGFGFGSTTSVFGFLEEEGTIPSPTWKEKIFPGDPWRLGDTYITAIGQYGFQVTPLQVVRAVSAIANGGILLRPQLLASSTPEVSRHVPISPEDLAILREGMRLAVTEGTASALAGAPVKVAAKTGTAELGVRKERVHSWSVGFFPYENPRFAFAVVLENGPRSNTIGASFVMKQLLEWMAIYRAEYLH